VTVGLKVGLDRGVNDLVFAVDTCVAAADSSRTGCVRLSVAMRMRRPHVTSARWSRITCSTASSDTLAAFEETNRVAHGDETAGTNWVHATLTVSPGTTMTVAPAIEASLLTPGPEHDSVAIAPSIRSTPAASREIR
jgi:hypothetical protein